MILQNIISDLILCATPKEKSKEEEVHFASDFLDLTKSIRGLNSDIHNHDNLYYLLECPSGIKDHLPLDGLSCYGGPKSKLYVCNWPILSQVESLKSLSAVDDSGLEPTHKKVRQSGKTSFSTILCLAVILMFSHCSFFSDQTLWIFDQSFVCWP